ncbi:hypothetical protein MUS1_04590 [Marinomonas ushuaiensis DSM 15871]|uniref:Uncharacterized protein n=1 Tax=Marinomonas ushuaiensis DSM 15871 TaxID=1122207 RepID=X7E2D0_9GAMM|nr:hypothetical protein [Marinomonas ushuaiensis]ETX10112.1 hypothetical protein MUS1_04590 [Marinomonas ushuaiensis DSM 15871]
MLLWQWALIASSVFFFLVFMLVFFRYLSVRKAAVDLGATLSTDDSDGDELLGVSSEEKEQWLVLLRQQKKICVELLKGSPNSDFQGKASLSCWSIFLDVEIHIIEHSVPDSKVLALLEAFKKILAKIDRAQEIDELFKSLKVNQSLLDELNGVIQQVEDKASSQVDTRSELNDHLNEIQEQLAQEPELDQSLAALRAEMASMCEFSERLKLHLDEVKEEGESSAYADTLSAFLNETDQSIFLDSMSLELDDKVLDLKQLAAYQKNIIVDLKEQVRNAKDSQKDEKHVGIYDVFIVRLEKSLLESGRVVKRLERKLESLQTIKYNLNIDIAKRDKALKTKEALLEVGENEERAAQGIDIYGVFDAERSTMKNMEDLLHQESFTEETDAFANEQSSKLGALRLMVNESELYVEMLERDLDKAHVLRESLERRLLDTNELAEVSIDDSFTAMEHRDLEEIENLREVNEELEAERKRLDAELRDGVTQSEELIELQKKVDELDDKIANIQEQYVEMEERYLTALMSKEDK